MSLMIFIFKVLWIVLATYVFVMYMFFEKSFESIVVFLLFVIANISFLNKREEI